MQGEYKTMTVFPRNSVMGTVPCWKQQFFFGSDSTSCTYQNWDPPTATGEDAHFLSKGTFRPQVGIRRHYRVREGVGKSLGAFLELAVTRPDLSIWGFPKVWDPQVTLE